MTETNISKKKNKKIHLIRIATFFFVIGIVEILSNLYSNFLFPGIIEILRKLFWIFSNLSFYKDISITILRVSASFISVNISAIILSFLSHRYNWLYQVVSTLLAISKAIPFVCIALILFFFTNSNFIPQAASFLLAFPIMFTALYDAVSDIDRDLLFLSDLYNVSQIKKMIFIFFPNLVPMLITSSHSVFPVIIKAIISTELLVYVKNGIGRQIEDSYLTLNIPLLFAWTIIAIILCACSDAFFLLLKKKKF